MNRRLSYLTMLSVIGILFMVSCDSDDAETPVGNDNTPEVVAALADTYWTPSEYAMVDSDGHELTTEEWQEINTMIMGGPGVFDGFYFGDGFVRIYSDVKYRLEYIDHEVASAKDGVLTFTTPIYCPNVKILSATQDKLVLAYLEDECLFDKDASSAMGGVQFKKGAYFKQTLVPASAPEIERFKQAVDRDLEYVYF